MTLFRGKEIAKELLQLKSIITLKTLGVCFAAGGTRALHNGDGIVNMENYFQFLQIHFKPNQ